MRESNVYNLVLSPTSEGGQIVRESNVYNLVLSPTSEGGEIVRERPMFIIWYCPQQVRVARL